MKTLLVKLPEPIKPTQKPAYMPPIGLWSIAHNTENSDVEVIDCHLLGYYGLGSLVRCLSEEWDVIGLSAQFSIQHDLYVEAARICSKYSKAKVISGGFHASAVPAPIGVHKVVKGEGEPAMCGKAFGEIDYPDPSFDRMKPYWDKGSPHDLQSKTDRWMPMEFSRGCSRSCGYCGVHRFWDSTRYYSREKIAKYLDALVDSGFKEIFIEDDNAASDGDMFAWIIAELGKRGIWWSTPNGIYAQELRKNVKDLAKNKCWRVSLPFETGVESTAKLMRLGNKWMPQPEALELVKSLNAEGIETCGFFIIGYPGETLDDIQRTLDYANSLPLGQRNISIATPYPGTHLYDTCVKNGYIDSISQQFYGDLLYTHGMINTEDWTAGQVESIKWRDREEAIRRRRGGANNG